MPGVTFTLLIGFAPAPPEVVDAVQQIEIEASTDVASVCRLRLGVAQTMLGDWSARLFWTRPVAKTTWGAATRAFRSGRTFRLFGHNAPAQVMTPAEDSGRIVWTLGASSNTVAVGNTLDLEGTVEGLEVGQRLLVVQAAGLKRLVEITRIEQTESTVQTAGGETALSGAATRVHVSPNHLGGNRRQFVVHELHGSRIRFANEDYPALLTGEVVYLPGVVVEDEELGRGVEVGRSIDREGEVPGVALFLDEVELGRQLLLADADPDREPLPATIHKVPAIEPAAAAVGDPCHLRLELEVDGALTLDRDTGYLLGNVTLASHGESVASETLGDGDLSAAFQRFDLKKSPLTFPARGHGRGQRKRPRVESRRRAVGGGLAPFWPRPEQSGLRAASQRRRRYPRAIRGWRDGRPGTDRVGQLARQLPFRRGPRGPRCLRLAHHFAAKASRPEGGNEPSGGRRRR